MSQNNTTPARRIMQNYNAQANASGLTHTQARTARRNHPALYGLLLKLIALAAAGALLLVFMPQLSVSPPRASSWIAPTATPTPQPELGEPPFMPVEASGE